MPNPPIPTVADMRQLQKVDAGYAGVAIRVRQSLEAHTQHIYGFQPPEHMLEWFEALQDLSITRLMIIAPPKYGKTPAMVDYAGWRIGDNPNHHIIHISNTSTQAKKPSVALRDTIETNARYRRVYRLELDRRIGHAASGWYVKRSNIGDKDPTFQACGIHGPILGGTVEEIILDDIADQENMKTQYMRDDLMEWIETTAFSRLIPGITRIIMICTRWNEDDPAARFAKKGWTVIELPAIAADDDEAWEYHEDGKPNWQVSETGRLALTYPSFWTPEAVAERREDLGLRMFNLMFQQKVMPDEGAIFKKEYWRFYDDEPDVYAWISSWDTAHEQKSGASYSAYELWGIGSNGYYLLDAWRDHVDFPSLKRMFLRKYEDNPVEAALVEKKASGAPLIDEFRESSVIPLVSISPTADKVARAHACTPTIEAGRVWLPREAPWLDAWMHEHEMFPGGAHDDFVDTTTQFLNWARRNTMGQDSDVLAGNKDLVARSRWDVR